MSRTHKIQRAYHAYKKDYSGLRSGEMKSSDYYNDLRDVGQRYGDQRKMRAKLKVSERRIERKKNNREAEKIIKEY